MSKLPKRPRSPAPTHAYSLDKRKLGFAIFLLLAFVGFGTWSLVVVEGPLGDRAVGAVLMLFCLGAAGFLARDFRREGPVVEVGPAGVLDRRKGRETIPWDRIAGAEIKRTSILRGIRLTLEDGGRLDIDTQLLEVDRKELMRAISEEGRKAEARSGAAPQA
jgi:hypothetical protein